MSATSWWRACCSTRSASAVAKAGKCARTFSRAPIVRRWIGGWQEQAHALTANSCSEVLEEIADLLDDDDDDDDDTRGGDPDDGDSDDDDDHDDDDRGNDMAPMRV